MKGNKMKRNAGHRNAGRGMGNNRSRSQSPTLWILSLSLIAIYFLLTNLSGFAMLDSRIFTNIILLAGILLLIAAITRLFNRRK